MPYKLITNVGKLCGRLAGAAFKNRGLIVDSLLARWRDRLPEAEDFSALGTMLTLVGEDLHQQHNTLIKVEDELRSELREDRHDRTTRDDSRLDLRELLMDSKKLLDLFYGPGATETFWEEFDTEVPIDPEEVHRLATRLRRNLLDPEFPRPPLRFDISVDLAQFAHRFDGPLERLGQSIRSLQQGTQGSNISIAAKERELELEQKQAILAGRLLEALTAYAGHEGVARRIRLSRHRATSSTPQPTDTRSPGSEPSANDSTADGTTPDGTTPDGTSPEGTVSAGAMPASQGPEDPTPEGDESSQTEPAAGTATVVPPSSVEPVTVPPSSVTEPTAAEPTAAEPTAVPPNSATASRPPSDREE